MTCFGWSIPSVKYAVCVHMQVYSTFVLVVATSFFIVCILEYLIYNQNVCVCVCNRSQSMCQPTFMSGSI